MAKIYGEVVPTSGAKEPSAAVISFDGSELSHVPVASRGQGEAVIREILDDLAKLAIEQGHKRAPS